MRRVWLGCVLLAVCSGVVRAQDDGGVTYVANQELLESIFVPLMPNAPFSLTLSTEWSRPMHNGGTFTIVNSRPLMRDRAGRMYQERWTLSPKGSNVPSRMTWMQIANPVDHTLYECAPSHHICELRSFADAEGLRMQPEKFRSSELPRGRGRHVHEDLGVDHFARLPVHRYRETTVMNPGTMGNDLELSTVRDMWFSEELGFNLKSVLDTPMLGKQVFTVMQISTTDPDPKYFLPPEGYRIIDYRKTSVPKE